MQEIIRSDSSISNKRQQRVCYRRELDQTKFLLRNIRYKNHPTTAIIFAFDGSAYAYINHCMHMHRPLNCQEDAIFDETGQYLRCSMHGFIFDPKTGECQSPVCLGQRLQTLRLEEADDAVYFVEKHLTLIG